MYRGSGIAAAFILLAGCNQTEPEPAPPPAAPTPGDIAGVYEATLPDGSSVRHTLDADGNYSEEDDGGNPVETGTWRLDGNQICYDPEGSEPEACYESGPSDDVTKVGGAATSKQPEQGDASGAN